MRVVRDDFVDRHLSKQGCRQADHLYGERGQQHVSPDPMMTGERGYEPAEAEATRFLLEAADRRVRFVERTFDPDRVRLEASR